MSFRGERGGRAVGVTEGRLLVIFLLENNVGGGGGGGPSLKFTRLSRCVNRKSKNYLLRFEQESLILQYPCAVVPADPQHNTTAHT